MKLQLYVQILDNTKLKLVPLDSMPKKHTFKYQNQINSCIMSIDYSICRFQVAAILKSNMAEI